MKANLYLILAAVILIGALCAGTRAQSRNRQQLHVEIPFAFTAANTVLPAGEYNVSIVNPSSDRSVLQIASKQGKATILVQTTDVQGESSSGARLVFRQYGEKYFLAQVWMAADSDGLATSSSKERSLRRQLSNTRDNFSIVAVNAQ